MTGRGSIMWRSVAGTVLLTVGVLIEAALLYLLKDGADQILSTIDWLTMHVAASLVASTGIVVLLGTVTAVENTKLRPSEAFIFAFPICLFLPFVGAPGLAVALLHGAAASARRHRGADRWQLTGLSPLPDQTPAERVAGVLDTRGFTEQLRHPESSPDLYYKVLAAGNMRAALSVTTLKRAVEHHDERIRLTAYQTLDRQVSLLNGEIQRLEAEAADVTCELAGRVWSRIASNYHELLTLEQDEPVARRQLLDKAATAATRATELLPHDRSVYLILGQVRLMQGDAAGATTALERSLELGMSEQKVVPYLAQAAFERREFGRVATLLCRLDDAIKAYPPLQHVARYWA